MGKRPHHRLPPYAVLLPAMPAAWVFAANTGRLTIGHAVLTACVLIAVYLAVRLVLRLAFRGHIFTDIAFAVAFLLAIHPVFLPSNDLVTLALATASACILASAWAWPPVRQATAVFLTVFPILAIGSSVSVTLTSPIWAKRPAIEEVTRSAFRPLDKATPTVKPDIYYLVFDRYARGDQLASRYGFDNGKFLDALRERGFSVIDGAYANYQRTTHSLISSLNFDYLEKLEVEATANSSDWLPLYRMLGNTRIAAFLKDQGYTFHFFGTWWEPTRSNPQADRVHNWFSIPEALRSIYERSLIVRLSRAFGIRELDPLWMQCERTSRMFARLASLDDKDPKFVFAHFLVPHPPYVFDEVGRCMRIEEAKSRSRSVNYVGQVIYVNGRILEALDALIARPGRKPIVIIQSDEGPWPTRYARDEVSELGRDVSSVNWRETSGDELMEKMAILSAVYLPGRAPDSVPSHASPVNTFRWILRDYFEVPIDPLPDRHFIYEDDGNLYRFVDVTERLPGADTRLGDSGSRGLTKPGTPRTYPTGDQPATVLSEKPPTR